MKIQAVFLLFVGCVWATFDVLMFFAIAGIADPVSLLSISLYWGGMLIGPMSLISGSCLVLMRGPGRPGAILVAIGCLALTGFAVYNSIAGMQRKPLQAPPTYSFYVVLLLIMLLADIAAFKVVRLFLSSHGPNAAKY
jgi:hypothetical protein